MIIWLSRHDALFILNLDGLTSNFSYQKSSFQYACGLKYSIDGQTRGYNLTKHKLGPKLTPLPTQQCQNSSAMLVIAYGHRRAVPDRILIFPENPDTVRRSPSVIIPSSSNGVMFFVSCKSTGNSHHIELFVIDKYFAVSFYRLT